jgi:PRTRC genetic system protein A
MTILADDPTAAAVLDAVPCYPVPPSGRSPAIEGLRDASAGHGLVVGRDGVMLILRRPWLAVDAFVTPALAAHAPYGSVGTPKADLRCGLIPRALLDRVMTHFTMALPNEAAAFVVWHEPTGDFDVVFPSIDEATPSRLVYRPPALAPSWHLVCDIHSHGNGNAFFSATDDADDAFATKISLVIGRLNHPDGPVTTSRLCAAGMFLPLPRSPFAGGPHAQ